MRQEIIRLRRSTPEQPQRLDLRTVRPLLDYLHGLPQDSCDRPLADEEDETACQLLFVLDVPEDCPRLEWHLYHYGDPSYRQSRSLCVWYAIARSVAWLIQQGE